MLVAKECADTAAGRLVKDLNILAVCQSDLTGLAQCVSDRVRGIPLGKSGNQQQFFCRHLDRADIFYCVVGLHQRSRLGENHCSSAGEPIQGRTALKQRTAKRAAVNTAGVGEPDCVRNRTDGRNGKHQHTAINPHAPGAGEDRQYERDNQAKNRKHRLNQRDKGLKAVGRARLFRSLICQMDIAVGRRVFIALCHLDTQLFRQVYGTGGNRAADLNAARILLRRIARQIQITLPFQHNAVEGDLLSGFDDYHIARRYQCGIPSFQATVGFDGTARSGILMKTVFQLVSLRSGQRFDHYADTIDQKDHDGFTKAPDAEAGNGRKTDKHIAAEEIAGEELDIRIGEGLNADDKQRNQK